jgi:hypothetical protein
VAWLPSGARPARAFGLGSQKAVTEWVGSFDRDNVSRPTVTHYPSSTGSRARHDWTRAAFHIRLFRGLSAFQFRFDRCATRCRDHNVKPSTTFLIRNYFVADCVAYRSREPAETDSMDSSARPRTREPLPAEIRALLQGEERRRGSVGDLRINGRTGRCAYIPCLVRLALKTDASARQIMKNLGEIRATSVRSAFCAGSTTIKRSRCPKARSQCARMVACVSVKRYETSKSNGVRCMTAADVSSWRVPVDEAQRSLPGFSEFGQRLPQKRCVHLILRSEALFGQQQALEIQ